MAKTELQTVREKLGLTKREMAVEMGVRPEYLSQIEHGSMPTTAKIETRLRAVVRRLAPPGADMTPDEIAIINGYRTASPGAKTAILAVVKAIHGDDDIEAITMPPEAAGVDAEND